jgi:hypothetical protein
LIIGNGITCDYLYNRHGDSIGDWTVQFDLAIPRSLIEAYLAPYQVASLIRTIVNPATDAEYEWAVESFESYTLYMFQDYEPPEGESYDQNMKKFGEALGCWLLTEFGGPDLKEYFGGFTIYDCGYDPSLVRVTANVSRAYVAGQITALEQETEVEPFQYYLDMYMRDGSYMDNFYNLPIEFRGQVTAWTDIPNMGYRADHTPMQSPEAECRNNYDATTPDGFLDLFGTAYTDGSRCPVVARAYHDTGPDMYVSLNNNLICFMDGIFEPGFMDPLLPVEQPDPPWPVQSSHDAALDGLIVGFINITRWKYIAELWFDNIARSLGHIWNLRCLLNSIMRSSMLDSGDFYIDTQGEVLTWDTEYPVEPQTPPVFTVHAGKVQVNGVNIQVSNINVTLGNRDSTYIWLNITLSNAGSNGQYGTVSAVLSETHGGNGNDRFSIGIGGIRKHKCNRVNGIPGYTLYQITQERHSVAVDIVRTSTNGVLYRTTSSASPYRALATANCN